MTMLEDQIATLLKAAPGEPPIALDPDALLATHSPRRARVLPPLLVAATVVSIAVGVAVATRPTDRTPAARPTTGPTSRPSWSYVHGRVSALDIKIVRKSFGASRLGARRFGAPTVRRTLTGPDAQQLARLVNLQPAQRSPDVGTCPGRPVRAVDSLLFHTARQILRLSITLDCTVLGTITERGRKGDYVYISAAELDRVTTGALGLPDKYGLGLRAGSSAGEPRVPPGTPLIMSRTAAETFARHGISAPDSAPTFSRLMDVVGFENTYHEPLGLTVNRSDPMWVVTVHAPVNDDGSAAGPPKQHDVYSIVIDSTTRSGVSDCVGCDWVKSDQ